MPQYLDESAITGRTAEGAPASTSRRILDESEITGQAQPERNIFQRIGDFVSDSGEQKKFGRTLLEDATAVGNFALSGPGMGVSWLAGRARAAEQLLKGKDRRTALQEGMETEQRVGVALTPKGGMAAIDRVFGSELTPGDTKLEAVMESLSKGIHHYGEKVEVGTDRALLAEDVDAFFSGAMGVPFAKHSLKKLENTIKAVTGTLPKELPRTPSQLAVLLGTDASKLRKGAKEETSSERVTYTEDAPIESVATILRPEPVVVESSGQLKALFDTAKKNRPPEISDVAAVETLFAKARSKGLAQIGPKSPYEAIAESKARIAEGKLLEEAPKVEGEPLVLPPELAPLNVALEKVKAGRAFDLTAEEKISLDHSVKIRDGQILDHNGRPFERGAVDPDLLKGILLAGGVAAYVAQNPEAAEAVAWISGGALAIKGKGGNWHPDAVKALAEPLRQTLMPGSKLEAIPVLQARLRLGIDVENTQKTLTQLQAADRMVSSYLNKHAGTATDPLKDVRLPDGQRWEDVTDKAFRGPPARNFQRYEVMQNESFSGYAAYDGTGKQVSKTFGEASDAYAWVKENHPKGFEHFKPDEPVWLQGQTRPFEALRSHLSHVGDFLRMNVKPEDLPKYDLVRAVKESAANDARVAKEMEKAAAASTKDLPVYKDYGDGMKWVELKLPETLTPEQARSVLVSTAREVERMTKVELELPGATPISVALDAQGKPIVNNYTKQPALGDTPQEAYLAGKLAEEGNAMGHCVGGYADEVASGATRILSLRDKKGQSHVTVELGGEPVRDSYGGYTQGETNILQIKGKQNRAPVDAYQPYVQDLVKSGTWGEVRDLQNTGGLVRDTTTGEYLTAAERRVAYDAAIKKYKDSARGSADPELLAKITAGTAAGAYLLSSDNAEQGLAAMGLGLAMSMKGAPEAALLAAAREGGPKAQAAFTELYRQNVKQAERTLQSKFGRQNVDIEGALQDGMTAALAAVAQGTFRGDSKFSTFLHTAVVNKALNQLEAQRVRPDTVSLTEDPATGRSGLAETLGHNETPANIALNKSLGKQIEVAMAKIDPRFREAFLAIEADGMSYEAAAEKFGVPVGTIRSRVSRAKEALQGYLRDYKDGEAGFDEAIPNRATGALGSREGGAADPRTLTAIAGVTGGAVVGSLMNPENSLRNGLYGALAGGLLGTAAGRAAMKSAIESPRNALGVISTELANIHSSLRLKLVEHEYRVLKNTEQVNDQVLPFLTALKKLSKSEAQRVDNALRNGDLQELGTTPEIRKTYAGVRRALDFVEGELKALGRFGEGVSEYFPRLVKDIEGLKAAIGSAHATGLEAVLKKANAKMIKKEGRTLTDVEESIVVNRYLFAPDRTSFQPGYAKGRRLKRIPDELQQFYEPSSESLLRYISGAIADIERAKFFGRDLQTKTQGGKIFTDLDSSIGNLTARLLAEGRIDKAQAMEVRRLLKARFEQGDKAMDPRLAGVRNVTNAALLGNIASAATQIGDPLFAVYHHGLVPTLQAMTESLVGKSKVTPKQLGLINHVAEELSEMGLTGRMLHETMKWSGFKAIDMFGKETHLNAALLKWKQKLATPQGVAAFRAKYGDAFPEIERVIQEVRTRKITPETELLSFFELSDAQPISKAEMPAAYLNNPNGRILYQLKTYMVKQADIVRRDAYQEIAKGTPEGIMRGAKNLAALGTMYALANVPGDVIKDWLAGRPVDPLSTPKLVENVLQTFGLNRYTQDKLQRGQVAETAIGMATPPLRVLQDIAKMDARSVSYVPGAGRTIYERYLGGNERKKIAEMKARKLQLRNEAEARDPGLKAARLLRERERRDRALRAARELR